MAASAPPNLNWRVLSCVTKRRLQPTQRVYRRTVSHHMIAFILGSVADVISGQDTFASIAINLDADNRFTTAYNWMSAQIFCEVILRITNPQFFFLSRQLAMIHMPRLHFISLRPLSFSLSCWDMPPSALAVRWSCEIF